MATSAKQFDKIQQFYNAQKALSSRRSFERLASPAPLDADQIASLKSLAADLNSGIADYNQRLKKGEDISLALNNIRNLMIQMHDVVLDGKINAEPLVKGARIVIRDAGTDLRAAEVAFAAEKRVNDTKKAALDRAKRRHAGLLADYRSEKRELEDRLLRSRIALRRAIPAAKNANERYESQCLKSTPFPPTIHSKNLSRPPANRKIGAVPSGAYKDSGDGASENKRVVFSCRIKSARRVSVCRATYAGTNDGSPALIVGNFSHKTATLVGYWIESKSNQKCRRKRRNSFYWGRIRFVFNRDVKSWKGKWNYCGGPLKHSWNGKK